MRNTRIKKFLNRRRNFRSNVYYFTKSPFENYENLKYSNVIKELLLLKEMNKNMYIKLKYNKAILEESLLSRYNIIDFINSFSDFRNYSDIIRDKRFEIQNKDFKKIVLVVNKND